MKITADTNVLVRAVVLDDATQTRAAEHELDGAELVALTLPALCEFVWVLSRNYKLARGDIAAGFRSFSTRAMLRLIAWRSRRDSPCSTVAETLRTV